MSDEPKVVWLLWDYGWGDGQTLRGVYSSHEMASQAARKDGGPYAPAIESWAVDAPGGAHEWDPCEDMGAES